MNITVHPRSISIHALVLQAMSVMPGAGRVPSEAVLPILADAHPDLIIVYLLARLFIPALLVGYSLRHASVKQRVALVRHYLRQATRRRRN